MNEIDFILSQSNGCEYVVLYQMLCLMAANTDGRLQSRMGEMIVPYTIDKIVRDTKYFSRDTVVVALELYEQLGLIYYENENGTLVIPGAVTMVGSESATPAAQKKSRQRLNKKLKESGVEPVAEIEESTVNFSEGTTRGTNCPTEYRVKSIEFRDKSLDKENLNQNQDHVENFDQNSNHGVETPREIEAPREIIIPYQEVKALFNEICVSYPKANNLSPKRKEKIENGFKNFNFKLDDYRELFKKAESIDFFKEGKGNWKPGFDWFVIPENMKKVLRGNYDKFDECVSKEVDNKEQGSKDVYLSKMGK